MTDYYTEDIARLQGQPKRTIGDYVESQGILVPRRFATLQEARNSGLPIIARSEHSQDYSGASGIVGSANLSWDDYKDIQSEEELRDKVMADPEYGIKMYKQLCRFSQGDEKKFKSEVSFSFWELLEGYNRTIVADSAVKGRYHVMTYLAPILKPEEKRSSLYNYAIVENGLIVQEFIKPLTSDLKEGLPKIIEFYESVRNLGKFDPNHCPIMEIQTIGDKNYFLQYHRARDSEPVSFRLERDLEEGEIEVPFVRGATQQEGLTGKVTIYYAGQANWDFKTQGEDGSWDRHWNHVFPELQVRQRKIQMTDPVGETWWGLMKFVVGHTQISKLFKPQISIVESIDKFLKSGETLKELSEFTDGGQNSYMNLKITSDGRRAFVRRVD